jgi:hypothetical protein
MDNSADIGIELIRQPEAFRMSRGLTGLEVGRVGISWMIVQARDRSHWT